MASNSFGLCGEDSLQASPAKKRSGTHAHRTSRALQHHFSSKVSHLSGISASALPRPARKARTRFGHHGPFEVLSVNLTSPNMLCHSQSDKWTAADCKAFGGRGQILVSTKITGQNLFAL